MSEKEALNIHEAHEKAELAHAKRALAPVTLTMAILAVLVAVMSMLGHRAHNEVLLLQTRANFQKAELVGNETQQHADAVLMELLDVLNAQNTAGATAIKQKINREMERYAKDTERVKGEERHLETEGEQARRKANRLDMAELFCEMALVLCSITLLTQQRRFWFAGVLAGAIGLVLAVTGFLLG